MIAFVNDIKAIIFLFLFQINTIFLFPIRSQFFYFFSLTLLTSNNKYDLIFGSEERVSYALLIGGFMASGLVENEAELLKSAAAGDTAAEEALVLRYTPLVYSQTRTCYRNGWERSDFVQEGMVGLIRAIREYSPERGVPFTAFAAVCIRNELYAALRKTLSAKNLPLEGYVSLSDRNGDALSELFSDSTAPNELDRILDRDEARQLVEELKNQLSPLEQKVFSAWLRGYSTDETSNALNLSRKSVDNAMSRIRTKGRRILLP